MPQTQCSSVPGASAPTKSVRAGFIAAPTCSADPRTGITTATGRGLFPGTRPARRYIRARSPDPAYPPVAVRCGDAPGSAETPVSGVHVQDRQAQLLASARGPVPVEGVLDRVRLGDDDDLAGVQPVDLLLQGR